MVRIVQLTVCWAGAGLEHPVFVGQDFDIVTNEVDPELVSLQEHDNRMER
jgi:hypothetical protein